MNSETRAALNASIEHWRRNEAALIVTDTQIGSRACPLCAVFFGFGGTCYSCPVHAASGRPCCENTPYDAIPDALADWIEAEDVVEITTDYGVYADWRDLDLGHAFLALWRARERFLLAARDERQFLESLLKD